MKTIALVIGINDYYTRYKLDNPINDAKGIKQIFERLGYDVIFKANGDSKSIVDLLTEFKERIKDYDATIFYFAGHGFEVEGENYLAFKDCQIDNLSKYHCNQSCILLTDLLDIYKRNSNKINIAIIDACRRSFDRGGVIATSPVRAPKGTLVAFSTSPNEAASDTGFDGNSIFTGSLLKYIGRERLSVEELFKKVRKTVYNLSNGKQTTWEHTSLIGDFYFNTGQLVYSLDIPYSEDVVKDANYKKKGEFGELIEKIKSYNWHIQNPAIIEILKMPATSLNKNQQFILGRNLLQAAGAAREAGRFMDNLALSLRKYSKNRTNHVLNGILFEIYFNPQGEFRKEKTKQHSFEEIIALRKVPEFEKSFEFISGLLESTEYPLIFVPNGQDNIFDIDIIANNETYTSRSGNQLERQMISKITCNSIDILKEMAMYDIHRCSEHDLRPQLASFLSAPIELIQINSNIELVRAEIIEDTEEDSW